MFRRVTSPTSRFLFLAAVPLLLATACKSNAAKAEVPCTCGTPEANLYGCAHSTCLEGKTNPDNPECVCGTLSIPR